MCCLCWLKDATSYSLKLTKLLILFLYLTSVSFYKEIPHCASQNILNWLKDGLKSFQVATQKDKERLPKWCKIESVLFFRNYWKVIAIQWLAALLWELSHGAVGQQTHATIFSIDSVGHTSCSKEDDKNNNRKGKRLPLANKSETPRCIYLWQLEVNELYESLEVNELPAFLLSLFYFLPHPCSLVEQNLPSAVRQKKKKKKSTLCRKKS